MPRSLKAILVLAAATMLIFGIDHAVAEEYPYHPSKPFSLAQSEPWRTVTTITGTVPPATNGAHVIITTCTLTGSAAPTPTTATKASATATAVTIAGTLTNTASTAQDYMVAITVDAGTWNLGGARVQLNNVAPGATVSWSAVGTVTNHPTQAPHCSANDVQSETAQ